MVGLKTSGDPDSHIALDVLGIRFRHNILTLNGRLSAFYVYCMLGLTYWYRFGFIFILAYLRNGLYEVKRDSSADCPLFVLRLFLKAVVYSQNKDGLIFAVMFVLMQWLPSHV